MNLNIGCGNNYRSNHVNIDKSKAYRADLHHDLETGLPFNDSTVDAIYARHILEHIKNLIQLMNECHRVLKPGGTIHILVPWWAGHWATGDPTHIRMFNDQSFNAWCNWFDDYPHINMGHRFKKLQTIFNNDPGYPNDQFLIDGGFSKIIEMDIKLTKI